MPVDHWDGRPLRRPLRVQAEWAGAQGVCVGVYGQTRETREVGSVALSPRPFGVRVGTQGFLPWREDHRIYEKFAQS